MKKALIALFASIGLVLGAGALGSTATAAYPGTVKTSTNILRTAAVTEGKTFSVKVKVSSGNVGTVGGSVKIRFGAKSFTGKVTNGNAVVKVKAPKVSKTMRRDITASYSPYSGSIFKKSSDASRLTVKNKK